MAVQMAGCEGRRRGSYPLRLGVEAYSVACSLLSATKYSSISIYGIRLPCGVCVVCGCKLKGRSERSAVPSDSFRWGSLRVVEGLERRE
jgi:hypothetical protein